MDDNFYYSSMRYEVYQLARKCKSNASVSANPYVSQSKTTNLKMILFFRFTWLLSGVPALSFGFVHEQE